MAPRLTIIKGQGFPEIFTLPHDKAITIGRSKSNDLVLRDLSASRQHAEVRHDDDQWLIRDLSMNGTYVERKKIRGSHLLKNGDVIAIANMKLRFFDDPSSGWKTIHQSSFLIDELQALYQFMTHSVTAADPRSVIERGLEIIHRQTQADLCGFLDPNPADPLPKIVFPRVSEVDARLSARLTEEVIQKRDVVRLEDIENLTESGSIAALQDALCLPLLTVDGEFLGTIHAYKTNSVFSERDVQFCKVLAGYAMHSLDRLRQVHSLTSENSRLRGYRKPHERMVGDGPGMAKVRHVIAKVAQTKAGVLILGQTGTGKELVAHEIHRRSCRSGLFVATNCAAIPKELMESELFGHVPGAFTGATHDRPGVFQQADEGTLFLDEIGDMSLACQAKLLRVLEGHPFCKLGGSELIHTNVRVIAATNKNLAQMVKDGDFRQDLLFRLDVVSITIPPLRERIEDVPALVEHFLQNCSHVQGPPKKISDAAMERLQNYTWPGNVRELRTVLDRAIILSDGDMIEPDDLRITAVDVHDLPPDWQMESVEAWAIEKVLKLTGHSIKKSAEMMGIGRDTMSRKVKEYGLANEL